MAARVPMLQRPRLYLATAPAADWEPYSRLAHCTPLYPHCSTVCLSHTLHPISRRFRLYMYYTDIRPHYYIYFHTDALNLFRFIFIISPKTSKLHTHAYTQVAMCTNR